VAAQSVKRDFFSRNSDIIKTGTSALNVVETTLTSECFHSYPICAYFFNKKILRLFFDLWNKLYYYFFKSHIDELILYKIILYLIFINCCFVDQRCNYKIWNFLTNCQINFLIVVCFLMQLFALNLYLISPIKLLL